MAQITTKAGDAGETGLLGPERVSKDDARIEALGALDEAQAALGLARSYSDPEAGEALLLIQQELYRLMGEISTSGQPDAEAIAKKFDLWTTEEQVSRLEADIAKWRAEAPSQFIIPGDTPFDGAMHIGRTLVRRAERRLVTLSHAGLLANVVSLRYLNRLSDWIFTFALHRSVNPPKIAKAKRRKPATEAAKV